MAYSTYIDVLAAHKPIPTSESSYITIFIADADIEIDLRLGAVGYSVPFDPVPDAVAAISKYKALYLELKRLYGSQVQEGFFEWVKAWDDLAEKLLKLLENGAPMGSLAVPQLVESTTEDFTPIFDLGSITSQMLHPDDNDLRYGEEE